MRFYEAHLDRKFERTLAMLLKLRKFKKPVVRDAGERPTRDIGHL